MPTAYEERILFHILPAAKYFIIRKDYFILSVNEIFHFIKYVGVRTHRSKFQKGSDLCNPLKNKALTFVVGALF